MKYEFFRKKDIFKCVNDVINNIGNPPWDYYFLLNLPESEYPKYLKKIYKYRTGKNLNLKNPKTLNEEIQWIKLYGITQLMRDLTDKVKVRDYVRERIGEEYLKPVLQIIPNESHETVRCHCEQTNDHLMSARQSKDISNDKMDCHADIEMSSSARNDRALVFKDNDNKNNDVTTYFDQVNFDKLPNSFVIKTNNGCKWQYIIKDKNEFLSNKRLFDMVKRNITGWLEQEYWCFEGFEMQYKTSRKTELPEETGCQEKGIEPKILIEPLMRDKINIPSKEIMVYFFNNKAKLIIKLHSNKEITIYDENLKIRNDSFELEEEKINVEADDIIKQTFVLSKRLVKDINTKPVRVDWMIYQNKPYFEEFTFTPYSGFNEKLERLAYGF